MMLHFHDRAVVRSDGKSYSHDGSPQDRRRAIAEAQADIALYGDALTKRSIAERGRPPSDREMRDGRYEPPDNRGPHEKQADSLSATAQYNPYSARLSILKSQRIDSKEIPALEAKALAWTPPVIEAAPVESPWDTAIAALQRQPGHLPEERAMTERTIARLREAGEREKQDQAKAAELQARFETDDFKNSVLNGESVAKLALLPNVPQSFVERANARLAKLKETGDTATYWRDTRAAESELNQHFDSIAKSFDEKKVTLLSDRQAALSMLPVSPPVVVEPPKSIIEQALMPKSPENAV